MRRNLNMLVAYRTAVIDLAREHGTVLARAHDDTTPEHVDEAISDGISISEFPNKCQTLRPMPIGAVSKWLMGAPNVVRGGSHSGNVWRSIWCQQDILDGLASNYVPSSFNAIGVFAQSERGN